MATGVNSAEAVPTEEDEPLGDYLLLTERLYDCYFVVGNPVQGPTERIGAVKVCLMNQSRVFRNMLSDDSLMMERGEIQVSDIQPSIFKLLLKHCYCGLDDCNSLSTEITVQLCYAAEKYLITSLKKKIADRLKPSCAADIFPALHCMVTYNVTDLNNYVTEIVREQTEKILSNEEFLCIDSNSLEFIVNQEILNCSELDIWKAIVKWANHKVQHVEGTTMRQWTSPLLKYIRLMTLTSEDLCKEVLPTNILTFEEFCQICSKNNQESDTICTVAEKRGVFQERWKRYETVIVTHENKETRLMTSNLSYSCLTTGDHSIMLESITCLGYTTSNFLDYYGRNYPCQVKVVISRITDYVSSASTEEPVVIKFDGTANYYKKFKIPTLVNGEGIVLEPNSMYKLKIMFKSYSNTNNQHPCWYSPACSDGHVFSHGKFYCSYIYEEGVCLKPSHIVKFEYSYIR